jgi:hypothetical protein
MRRALHWTLMAFELFLAVAAMSLTWGLLRDPTGNSLDFPSNLLLVGTPFDDYLVPAMVAFVVCGAVPLFVAVGGLFRRPWAPLGHVLSGVLFLGWAGLQVVLTGFGSTNQVAFFAVGGVLTVLAVLDFIANRKLATESDADADALGA